METIRHWNAWRQALRLIEVGWVPIKGNNANNNISSARSRILTPTAIRLQTTKSLNRVAPMTTEEETEAKKWKDHLYLDMGEPQLRPSSSKVRDAYLKIESAHREKVQPGDNELRPLSSSGHAT